MSKTIAVVGSSIIDFITYSARSPKCGETIIGNKYEQGFGGKGANQCVAAARLGASTLFITSLGSDLLGEKYLENLKNEEVDVHSKIYSDSHTGIAQIRVTETGENSIVIVQGTNALLSPEDIIEAKEKIQSAAVLLCQFEIPLQTVLEALKIFKGHGLSIVNGAPAVINVHKDILELSDIFCVNETEAEVLTGIENLTIYNAQEAINKLFLLGCNTVIITFGDQGVIHQSKGTSSFKHTPSETVKAVDTTGAGDAFLGSLAYFLTNYSHLSLDECIRRSNKIAAESVLKKGTQTSFPYKKNLPNDLFLI